LEDILTPEFVASIVMGLLVVFALFFVGRFIGFFDLKVETKYRCSRCGAKMTKAEAVSSFRYFREKSEAGIIYCLKCQKELLKKSHLHQRP